MAKKKNLKQKMKEAKNEVENVQAAAKDAVSAGTAGFTSSKSTTGGMLFGKENYIFMGIGLVLILLGFALMAGGKSPDPNVFAGDELYSFRRITLAPILVLLGFAVEGYAIFKTPSTK